MSEREVLKGLVALEGIDGSGTTMLSEGLYHDLVDVGAAAATGAEPTTGPIGSLIRVFLEGRYGNKIDPEVFALLFAADRVTHIANIKKFLSNPSNPILKNPTSSFYITDRYLYSSLVYQSSEVDPTRIEYLNKGVPLPEKLIYLHVTPEKARERLNRRSELDILETAKVQEKASALYPMMIHRYDDFGVKAITIDGTMPQKDLRKKALKFVLGG